MKSNTLKINNANYPDDKKQARIESNKRTGWHASMIRCDARD